MRTKTFSPKERVNDWKEYPEKSTRSTLLIPACYMKLFHKRLKANKHNPTEYLSYLLESYRILIRNGEIPVYGKLETGYQEEGLKLQRVDFIPKGEDWAEMKCLKAFLNRSMTWIFVYLLVLDSLDIKKNLPEKFVDFVVPKKAHLRLMVIILFSRKRKLYRRILRHTRDRTR
ncbi:MAG TPA: DUF1564 family protein [Leptospiraceae bacterium]|nr:DUF1564 family protein [Leptospiraceae bacterium]HRG73442.1 DUF1564 family protein [Leptospiraceae bacterium]